MKPTRPLALVGLLLAAGAITWLVVRTTYTSLPTLPWSAVPTLLLLALGEGFTAINLRARIQRKKGTKPIEPLVVARMAALGKASAYAAMTLAGVFGGFLVHLGSSLDKTTPRHDFLVSGGTFIAAIVLVAAAMFLEYSCRVPKGPDDEDDRRGPWRA